MTLEEVKELARREQEERLAKGITEVVEGEVLDVEVEDGKDADDYLKALYMLEEAAEMLDDLTDHIEHKIPVTAKMRKDMVKLSSKIVNYLIDVDDDDDDEDAEV